MEPDLQEVVSAVGVVLQVEDGEVEQDLLPGGDLDDPGALTTVAVGTGPAGRMENSAGSEEVAATC